MREVFLCFVVLQVWNRSGHYDNSLFQGDLFSGLNDGLISRAEALAAVDIKHQSTGAPAGLPQLKHDMMYHHSMGAPPPVSRPHQVKLILFPATCLSKSFPLQFPRKNNGFVRKLN
jgi:hypothetical protein